MKPHHIVLITLLSCLTAFMTGRYLVPTTNGGAPVLEESAYDRVIRTGTIRCGYTSWDPMLIVDTKTKKITGIAAETIEAAASYLNLKVEWVAEYGWSDFILGLENGQVDVFCAGPTPSSARARVALFTDPFLYGRFPIFARTDDQRFDHNSASLNRPETKIGAIDGTTAAKIITKQFPQATITSLPETASFSQLFEDLADKKTDATLQAAALGALYIKNNPGKIHEVPGLEAIRVLPHIFILRSGEFRLKEMLDAALRELIDTGTIEAIVQKYDPGKQSYFLPALTYSKSTL